MNQRQPLGCSPQHTPQLAQRFALPWHLEPRARWGPWHPATTDGVTYLQLAQRGTCREAATFLSLLFLLSAGEKKKKKHKKGPPETFASFQVLGGTSPSSHPAWKRVGREEGCLSPPRARFQLQPLPATPLGSLVGAAGGSRSLSEQHCYSDQVNSPPADRSPRRELGWEGSREEDSRSLDFLRWKRVFFTCSAPRSCCHGTEPAGTGT